MAKRKREDRPNAEVDREQRKKRKREIATQSNTQPLGPSRSDKNEDDGEQLEAEKDKKSQADPRGSVQGLSLNEQSFKAEKGASANQKVDELERQRRLERKARKLEKRQQEEAPLQRVEAQGHTNGGTMLDKQAGNKEQIDIFGGSQKSATKKKQKKAKSSQARREAESGDGPGVWLSHEQEKSLALRPPDAGAQRVDADGLEQSKELQPSASSDLLPRWQQSQATGGQMLDIDPVFSLDEEHLIVAFQTYVAVYATATSLLIRKLHSNGGQQISSMALCPSNPDKLYIGLILGSIETWDWTDGSRIEQLQTTCSVVHIAVTKLKDMNEQPLVYSVQQLNPSQKWQLSVCTPDNSTSDPSNVNMKMLFTFKRPLSSVRVLYHGTVVIMTSGNDLIIGTGAVASNLQEMKYSWRTVSCPEWITSIDIEAQSLSSQDETKSIYPWKHAPINIAVGGLKGAIHLYDNLVQKLFRDDNEGRKKKQADDITSRNLHWHRNSVLTVKWSLDGNYLISGGQETVLVMWQLDTGRKDTLPHLGAPVESVVVSPNGASYGIRLADNSVMIISTTEMKPSFSIAGVQMPSQGKYQQSLPPFLTVDDPAPSADRVQPLGAPTCVCPSKPHQILSAVPPFTASRTSNSHENASYLQTIDATSGHQLAKQALTRTKVTTLNIGPESNAIREPNVTHIATSCDGKWLATVDEWMPPTSDLESLAFDRTKIQEEQIFRQEIHLKFWSWDDNEHVWQLVTRIDQPHASESGDAYESGRILALVSDPSSACFSTFGEDGQVKAWKRVVRRRNGSIVKDKDGTPLTNWHIAFTSAIGLPPDVSKRAFVAKLCFSPDGSLIALSLRQQVSSPIYLLDAATGLIEKIQSGLASSFLCDLGIIDRFLIVVSQQLTVWDLVDDKQHYGMPLNLPAEPLADLTAYTHLAIQSKQNTFALVTPQADNDHDGLLKGQIAVFDPSKPEPLTIQSLAHPVTALLPAVGQKGYHIIDTAAEITTISPHQITPIVPFEPPKVETKPPKGLSNILGKGDQQKSLTSATRQTESDEKDAVNVTQHQIAEIFEQAPAYALPPVQQLFEQVAQLVVGREVKTAA